MIHRIRAEHLLTDAATVHSPGVLDHQNGQVVWSGAAAAAPDRPDADVTEVSGVLMPGLVNAHAHTAMVVLRGAGENLPVDRWLHEVMWPREAKLSPDDVRAGMTLGTAELLANGVTTSLEMYFHGQAMAEAVDAVGIRSIVTAPIIEEAQLARFGTWQQQLGDMVEMADTWASSDRVQVGIGPHAVYSTSEACLRAVAEAAAERQMLVHIHVDEQQWEDAAVRSQTGGFGATEWLSHVGMFATKVVAAHCVWSSDSDIDLFARHDVGVSHCPCSNTKHGSGAARVTAMRGAGVKVGLGTDGPASHHRLDMFEEMRTALRLARVSAHDPQALTPADVLAMATSESADAIARPDLGRLHPGSKADMISVDMGRPAFHPIVAAEDDLVSRLVWGATPADVRSVWVGGTLVAHNGDVASVDLPAALARVGEIAERLAR